MNIFLTGKIDCGKSTIINQFLVEYSGSVSGYKTVRESTHLDEYFGVYMQDMNGNEKDLSLQNKVGDCYEDKSLVCCENVFNTLGVGLLENYQDCDLVVMDEIGILERDCEPFKAKIIEVLDSDTAVLGVIKQKDSAFLNSIRKRKDVTIIEITRLNNQDVLEQLKNVFYL